MTLENTNKNTLVDSPSHNDVICSHLYNNGYIKGLYADLILRIVSPNSSIDGIIFKIHRILAIKSPYFLNLLTETEYQPATNLNIQITDPHITPEGLGIAIGHLYAAYSSSILQNSTSGNISQRSSLLTSVLSSALLLRLPDLAHLTIQLIKADININSVPLYTHFVANSERDYGKVSQEIRDTISEFLCRGAFLELKSPWDKEGEDYILLVQLFASLPFEWLKNIIESNSFVVPSDMERFTFAKKVVSVRAQSKPKSAKHAAGEENVLLSFGASKTGSSGVTIVRKAPRQSPVNGNAPTGNGFERKIWKAI